MTIAKKFGWFLFFCIIIAFVSNFLLADALHASTVGASRNTIRESLKVPPVPQNWKCNKVSGNFFLCSGTNTSGHLGKEIKFSGAKILFERDTYKSPCRLDSSLRIIVESKFYPDFRQSIWREQNVSERKLMTVDSFSILVEKWTNCD